MDANDLRALADEMQSNIDEVRIILRGKITVEDKAWFAMHDKAIDYLRACADAQPVAWMHIDGRVISAATMDQAYRDGGAMQSSLRDYTIPIYTHPAPAAPQEK